MRNIIHRCAIIATIFFLLMSGIRAQSSGQREHKFGLGLGVGIAIEMEQVSRLAYGLSASLKYSINEKSSWIFRSHFFRHLNKNTLLNEPTTRTFYPVSQWQMALGWETAIMGTLRPTTSHSWGLSWSLHSGYSQSRHNIEQFDYFPGHQNYHKVTYQHTAHALVVSSGLTLYHYLESGTLYLEALPQLNLTSKTNLRITNTNANPETKTESYSAEEVEFSGVMINVGYRWTW